MKDKTYNISLTAEQRAGLIEFIEFGFIDYIRSNEDIDDFDYLRDICDIYKLLMQEKEGAADG